MLRPLSAFAITLGVGAALSLQACDNGPSAVANPPASSAQALYASPQSGERGSSGSFEAREDDARAQPVRQLDGKPLWSASRRYSAEENAQRAFDRNGEAFGARNVDDFARKARAFIEHPPAGVQTLKRANGDVLLYDPKGNVFAVATREGAPRTMFKPDDGQAYWDEQKSREARRQASRSSRSDRDDG